MKIKHLISTIIIATLAMIPISANASEVDVQPTTFAEESVVAQYPEITEFYNTATGTQVSWSAYDGADRYRLYYWDGSMWKHIGTTASLSLTHNNLSNEMTYVYTVRAIDSEGNSISDYNHNGYENTFYAPPVISSITNTKDGVEIKWGKIGTVDNYRIYRKTNSSNWVNMGECNGTSFVDKKAISGTTYTYTVRCLNENGNQISFFDSGRTITYIETPIVKNIENTATGAQITWSACPGASRYRVFSFENNAWKSLGITNTTSFVHQNLKSGTTYIYTVRCIDSNYNYISGYNNKGYTNTFYAPPQVTSLTNTNNGVEVKWGKINSVNNYRLYRKTNNSGWTPIAIINGTTYLDKNVNGGNYYTYTVRCLDENNQLISYYNNGKSITYVNTPSVTKIENTATGATITWSACPGASRYRVFCVENNAWKSLGITSSTSFTHEGLKTGETYKYTVRCIDSNYNYTSGYNNQGYTNTFYAPPVISSITNTKDGVEIKWGKIGSVNNYRIYRKTNNSGWTPIAIINGTTYLDKNVSGGTRYTYTVRCLNKNNQLISYYNNGKSITFVKAPTVTLIENTATGAQITWSACAGATRYRVFSFENNAWKSLGITSSTSFVHQNLKAGKTYIYTVRCIDSNNYYTSGYNNQGYANTFYAPPQISSVSKATNGNLIKWQATSGVAGYRLYRKTLGSSWSILANVTGTSYVDTSAKNNTLYTYTLRCLDKNKKVISFYVEDTKYYYNGSLANGTFTIGNSKYTFYNGIFKAGLQTINGNKYYYNSSGVLQKNGIVGSDKDGYYYADKNGKIDFTYCNAVTQSGYDWNVILGKATKVRTESDRTQFRALKIVAKITNNSMTKSQKLKVCFDYVKGAYVELNPRIPHYCGNDWPILYANDMFVNGAGNCFSYAAAFAYMAKGIGYTEVYCCNSGGHGWAEIDGLVYDPEWSRHHSTYSYYALSYDTKTDQNYKGAISAKYSWMHVKI